MKVNIMPKRETGGSWGYVFRNALWQADGARKLGSCRHFLGSPDPMSTGNAIRTCLCNETAPRCMVLLDQAQRLLRTVDLEVQCGLVTSFALLEVVDPLQALLHTTRTDALHVLDRACLGKRPSLIHIHGKDLPICLALVDQEHCTKRAALHNHTNTHGAAAEVQNVKWVVIARRVVQLVHLLRVTVGLRQTAVVEGHRPAEGREPC